jgi:thiol-disulfide isomerase/thioredoxin
MEPERRRNVVIAALAIVAVAGVVAFFVYDVVLTRPRVERHRPSPAQAFGIERASVSAPPLELTALDGSRLSLASLRGQVVFVNFWATWCPPCRDEMPSMVRLGQELASRHPGKFRMIAVSVDEGWDPVKEYFAAPPFGGPPGVLSVVLDPGQQVTRAYYCSARGVCPDLKFPETYIVDKGGRLVGYVVGPRDWSHPAAREYLEQLIGS